MASGLCLATEIRDSGMYYFHLSHSSLIPLYSTKIKLSALRIKRPF